MESYFSKKQHNCIDSSNHDLSISVLHHTKTQKLFTKASTTQVNVVTATRKAELQLTKMVPEAPNLFPAPDYEGDTDSDTTELKDQEGWCRVRVLFF